MSTFLLILVILALIGGWRAKVALQCRTFLRGGVWCGLVALSLVCAIATLRSWNNVNNRVNAMTAAATTAEARGDASDFARVFPMVAVPKGAGDAHKLLAHDIAKAIGGPDSIGEMDRNPVCCIWVEITGWTPNPGEAGWTIINQPGGSVISASDVEQLRAAVDAFKKSIRVHDKDVEVPVGMLTSYPVRGR